MTGKGRQHRKYHRVSTYSPDQQAIVKYLMQRGYDVTLKMFQEEIQNQLEGLIQEWEQCNSKNQMKFSQFRQWVDRLKGKCVDQGQAIRLEFMLIVWYCSLGKNKQPSKQSLKHLKTYIEQKGTKLSENPQLLSYFALPYISQPLTHPFLNRIYTKQWKQQLRAQIQRVCTVPIISKQQNKGEEQNQWFLIVKDLVSIALTFGKYVQGKEGKEAVRLMDMLERVRKYQEVIDVKYIKDIEGVSVNASDLSNLIYLPQQPENNLDKSFQSISSVHNPQAQPSSLNIQQIKNCCHYLSQNSSSQHHNLCLIFFLLNKHFYELRSQQQKKQEILKYIENDIFLGKDKRNDLIMGRKLEQIQCMKLINNLCFSNKFIRYLGRSIQFVRLMAVIVGTGAQIYVGKNVVHNNQIVGNQAKEERLLEAFGVLQKVSFSKHAIQNIMKTELISDLIQKYLAHYSLLPTNILTYALALLLNILLKQQGKIKCSSLKCPCPKPQNPCSLVQQLIKIWNYITTHHSPRNNNRSSRNVNHSSKLADNQSHEQQQQTHLQSLIYSIFYVMLSLEDNRKIAQVLNLKKSLTQFLFSHDDQYHRKVINSILEVLQGKIEVEKEDEDQQSEQENCQDEGQDVMENKEQFHNYMWVGDKVIEILPNEQPSIGQIIKKVKEQQQKEVKKEEIKQKKEGIRQKKQDVRQMAKISQNLSAPLSINKNQNIEKQKQNPQEQRLQQNKSAMNTNQQVNASNVQKFENVSGYDPNKYVSWKRLKTTKN